MYACAYKTRTDFSRRCAGKEITHLLFATHHALPYIFVGGVEAKTSVALDWLTAAFSRFVLHPFQHDGSGALRQPPNTPVARETPHTKSVLLELVVLYQLLTRR
jgi:hypothetical protein